MTDSPNTEYDVIIVGAGAAGLMAAIAAAGQEVEGRKARVLVLDSQVKIGAKILVAGGGRCNVTNEFVDASRFNTAPQGVPLSKSFVARVLRSFSVEQTHRFFDALGVPLKLEETGKYFPVSDSSRTVLKALLDGVQNAGAELRTGCPVTAIRLREKESETGWQVRTAAQTDNSGSETAPGGEITTQAVILCTGGLALPKSGSNGVGYEFAKRQGHTLVSTTPALTPLLSGPIIHAHLSGITLPVRLALRDGNNVLASFTGSFLFTHTGYSGPVALNISRHFARHRESHPNAVITMRLLPDVPEGEDGKYWQDWVRRESKKSVFNTLAAVLPKRVAETVIDHAKLNPNAALGKLSPQEAARLRRELFDAPLPIVEVAPYHKAEATAGGISLDEIESATMMSKLKPGLFFAGEICDVDGWLGGYNFQWAWSSGTVAGRSAAKLALKSSSQPSAISSQ